MSTGVVVLAATNRLPAIDNALLRPGRLDILQEVSLPNSNGRLQVRVHMISQVFGRLHNGVHQDPTLSYKVWCQKYGVLQILQKYTQRMPLAPNIDLAAIAAATKQFTGADLEGLCQEAAFAALRNNAQVHHPPTPTQVLEYVNCILCMPVNSCCASALRTSSVSGSARFPAVHPACRAPRRSQRTISKPCWMHTQL